MSFREKVERIYENNNSPEAQFNCYKKLSRAITLSLASPTQSFVWLANGLTLYQFFLFFSRFPILID